MLKFVVNVFACKIMADYVSGIKGICISKAVFIKKAKKQNACAQDT